MRTTMPNQQKVEKVEEIKERLRSAQAAYFADYRGLSVPDIGEVRTALLEAEAAFSVLKNTLTRLAVRDLEMSELESFLEGPTAVAFVQGDIVAGAKALVDATKRFPVLEVKGGLAEGRVLGADEIRALAALETREEMLAKVAGLLSMHMRKAAYLMQALQSRFASLLSAYREKLEEEAPAEEPPSEEAPAEEPPSEEPPAEEAPSEDEGGDDQASAEQAEEETEEAQDEEQEEG
ncbi:MAG TPA: 50S ribosomal protein L10 [Actinomycetota bacterium]